MLAGKPGFGFEKIKNKIDQSNSNVELLGYVSEEQKNVLQRESKALLLVSEEEGFGIPVLEGFDWGTSVIASDIPTLREVGGDACIYVNNQNPKDIADGLEFVVGNYDESVPKGFLRLGFFDWNKTINTIIKTFTN